MAKQIPLETFEKLPKTDLHVHLDGSLRLATILDLAQKQRVELPAHDEDGLRAAMNLGKNCGSLVEYLKAFDVTLRVMQDQESLTRIAYELAEDAAHENVRYMEVRYSPMLHTRRGLKLTTVVEAVLEGLRDRLGPVGLAGVDRDVDVVVADELERRLVVLRGVVVLGAREVEPDDAAPLVRDA